MSLPAPRRLVLALAAGALLATGATACETTPPPAFTVEPGATGADADPGDGVCATTADECSLQAAVEEANALDVPSEISVPDGVVAPVSLTVTGSIDLMAAETEQDLHEVDLTIAEGAQVVLTDGESSRPWSTGPSPPAGWSSAPGTPTRSPSRTRR